MRAQALLPDEALTQLDRGEVEAAGVCLVSWGQNLARSRPGEAFDWADHLLETIDRRDPLSPFARWAAGAVHHLVGHTKSARLHLETAARSFTARRRPDLADRVRLALIDVYGEGLDLGRARRMARTLEPRFSQRGDHQRAGVVLANLGCAEDAGDNVLKATKLWRRARRRLSPKTLPGLLVEANLANAAAMVGQFDEARRRHHGVIEAAAEIELEALVLQAELNLAEVEFATGQVKAAMDRWLDVADRAEKAGSPLLQQVARLELAQAEVAMGNTEVARQRLESCLPELEAMGLELEKARAIRLLAVIELASSQPDQDVLLRARAELDHTQLRVQRELFEVERAQLDDSVDPARVRRAARHLARSGLGHRAQVALSWAARRWLDRGQTALALSTAQEVLAQRQVSPWARMTAHHVCARALGEQSPASWKHLNHAVQAADRLHGRLASAADRSAFLQSHGELFLDLIWRLVRRNRPADRRRCLDLIHRLKSGWLLDELSRRTDRGSDPLVHRWQLLRRQLSTMLETAEGENEPRLRHTGVAIHRRVRDLEMELQAVETDLARSRPALATALLAHNAADSLIDRLPRNHTYVEYLVGRTDLLICVVENGRLRLHHHPGAAREVHDLVASIRFHVDLQPRAGDRFKSARGKSLDARLRRLGQLLLDPLPNGGWEQLWLAPHNGLYHLPWAALITPSGESLIDHGIFSIVPDAAMAGCRTDSKAQSLSRVALGGAGGDSLPMVNEELHALAELLPDALKYENLDRSSLLELLTSHDVIHLAGHALFLDGLPSASGLRLEDGYLTVHDLAATPITTRLITFGVCSGVRLAERDPFRYEGFLRALLGGGVQTVVGPVAQIPDDIAYQFDCSFYQELSRQGTTGAAFVGAVNTLRQTDPNPATWGIFHHYGDVTTWRVS